MIPILRSDDREALAQRLLSRTQLDDAQVVDRVKEIIGQVRKHGDDALMRYSQQFDGATVTESNMLVGSEELAAAYAATPPALLAAMREAAGRIRAFHEKQKQQSWIDFGSGSALGQMVRPLERVGVYVPGGTAGYPSSVLMNALPAKVAGVSEIIMVTPPSPEGGVSCPPALVAADIAGVDKVYRVGGAQAIAALAFGTRTIPKVDKIVGPGNIYVANAKREVFGHVGIDMVAGPSEVLVIADESANPRFVAADMLSQAEHDPLAAAIVVVLSEEMAQAVAQEAERQLALLPRAAIAGQSIATYGTIIVAASLQDAADIANEIAPEHLELCVANPFELLGSIRNAGAIFLGHWSPEPLGDYFAGPNHVLPTSGTARFFSPLGVDDFIKKSSIIYYSEEALRQVHRQVQRLALSEGLDAHARSLAVRFGALEEAEDA